MASEMYQLPINVAIVGLGRIGFQYDYSSKERRLTHASAIWGDARFKLIGGCDKIDRHRDLFEREYGVQTFSTIKEMMELSDPDVVVIATETDVHVENIFELLEYNSIKLLLCEKPITRKLEDLSLLASSVESSKKHVLMNYQRRTEVPSVSIRKMLIEKKFGNFLGGSGFYSRGFFNNGSHVIDLLEWWFESKSEFLKLIDVCQNGSDYDVSLALGICNQNFLLQSVPTMNTSILEITLQFDLAQIRYLSGGSVVYIDNVSSDIDFQGIDSIVISSNSEFPNVSLSLASVYSDIYSKLSGGYSHLSSVADAINLTKRMQNYVIGGLE